MKILKILVVAIELGLTAGISAEPEPRNPVAEGLSSDVKEVDVDQLDGNQLWFALRKMEHDQPRLDATVKRLTGRVVTFENVPFVRVLEKSSADGFVRVELGCPGKDRKRDYDWDFRMDVRFPTGLEGVECLDPRIRLQSVKVRFLGTPNCMGVSFDGLAVVVPPAADPLVGKDAKKITGDQLADLV